ncbi:hypothetical protein IE81DRAFT_349237 [Ceraceosorus guamensis]|uniref:Uncharacterized protein n=1 Tax=Ceraceosorus guamensis TaxID=1522189 RepID=A0A316VST8_9BASI|nr:hypothetical protein IE81DRAFT_349237 [Ceraceosorus guamensis]PWN40440.1 hypothetical protein IE81DRAFT_349237 [Ceraceosorus guamensis]
MQSKAGAGAGAGQEAGSTSISTSSATSTSSSSLTSTLVSLQSHLSKVDLSSPVLSLSSGDNAHSLLSLKPSLMLEYLQALSLLSSFQLSNRSISSVANDNQAKELVVALIRIRLCLERVRVLELRAKPGIDRVVRAAEESQSRIKLAKKSGDKQTDEARVHGNDDHDLLSFRPNLDAFASMRPSSDAQDDAPSRSSKDGIYRPPRLAPVPYTGDRPRVRRGADQVEGGGISSDEAEADGPDSSRSRSRRALPRNASLLNDLSQGLSSLPYEASSSGSGGGALQGSSSASTSHRARKLAEMQEYEESNLTRLATSGKEAKRRRKEEESLALGGGERGGGADSLMNEFGGLLSSRGGGGGGGAGGSGRRKRMEKDAYEELRGKGRDKALDRARGRRGDAKGNPQFLDSAQTRPASLGKSKFKKDLKKERSKRRS